MGAARGHPPFPAPIRFVHCGRSPARRRPTPKPPAPIPMETPSLLDLTRALATDDATKAAFRADPEGFLEERGWGDLEPDDLATALAHVADALPVHLAGALYEL